MMTVDQNQLLIRSFLPDKDIPKLVSLYSAVEAVDHDGYEINEQTLQAQLDLLGMTPSRIVGWLIAPDGSPSLIASGVVSVAPGSTLAEANILVHPDWRQRGVGTTLLSKVVDRSRQLDAGAIQIYANVKHPAAPGFLAKAWLCRPGRLYGIAPHRGRPFASRDLALWLHHAPVC